MSKIAIIGIVGNSVFLPVDEFGVGGETVDAKSVHFELGGKGFNQALREVGKAADNSFPSLPSVTRDGGGKCTLPPLRTEKANVKGWQERRFITVNSGAP